jgi:hypothetical protein
MENNDLIEIKKMLRQNAESIEDIQRRMMRFENYLRWQKIWAITKILIIAVPIILSIIYLPPLFRETFHAYQELLGTESYNGLGL